MSKGIGFHVSWPGQQCYPSPHYITGHAHSLTVSLKNKTKTILKNKKKIIIKKPWNIGYRFTGHPFLLTPFFSWLSCSFSQSLCLSFISLSLREWTDFLAVLTDAVSTWMWCWPRCFFQVWLACLWPAYYLHIFFCLISINWLHK